MLLFKGFYWALKAPSFHMPRVGQRQFPLRLHGAVEHGILVVQICKYAQKQHFYPEVAAFTQQKA